MTIAYISNVKIPILNCKRELEGGGQERVGERDGERGREGGREGESKQERERERVKGATPSKFDVQGEGLLELSHGTDYKI